MSEKEATGYQNSKDSHKREAAFLAMSEDVKEYIGEATQTPMLFWKQRGCMRKIRDVVPGKDAAAWDQTGKKGESSNEKLWNWSQSNGTKWKNLSNDGAAVLAMAVDGGGLKQVQRHCVSVFNKSSAKKKKRKKGGSVVRRRAKVGGFSA